MVEGRRTALTVYSPYVYSPGLHVARREELLALLTATWDAAAAQVERHVSSYSIDFAVAPDLSRCWVVEVNAFLPPLAGSGLFRYAVPADRAVLAGEAPFEFRVKTAPLAPADFVHTSVKSDGSTRTTTMAPAPPHVMRRLRQLRREVQGLPPAAEDEAREQSGTGGVAKSSPPGRCLVM